MRLRVYVGGQLGWTTNVPANGMAGPGPYLGDDGQTHRKIVMTGELVIAPPAPGKNEPLTPTQAKLDARPVVPGRPRKYATEEDRLAARRATYRASKARRNAA